MARIPADEIERLKREVSLEAWPRRGARRRRPPVGDPSDPQGMAARCAEYLEWMRTKNYSERTVENRAVYLAFFLQWAEDRGVTKPLEVTRPILERYQRHLYHYRKPNGRPLSFRSQYSRLVPVRAFFKWLARQNHLLYNSASDIELPRLEHRLPKHVLTASEVEAVLAQPDVADTLGLRDRALLETLYSTGMRRMELAGLALHDLDVERGTLMIRQGKAKSTRPSPVTRFTSWISLARTSNGSTVKSLTRSRALFRATGRPWSTKRSAPGA